MSSNKKMSNNQRKEPTYRKARTKEMNHHREKQPDIKTNREKNNQTNESIGR